MLQGDFIADSFRSSDLSERLNLSKDEGEKWIVNLIRETRMGADAKIDLENVNFRTVRYFSFAYNLFSSSRT